MKLKYGPYSPSRLSTGVCGYSFYRQYIDENRKKEPGNLPQDRGSAVHEIFEKVTEKLIRTKKQCTFSENEIRNWVVEAVNRYPAAAPETGNILKMVRLYIDRPPVVLTDDAEIELRLAIKLDKDENGNIKTYLDKNVTRPSPAIDKIDPDTGNPVFRRDPEGGTLYLNQPVERPVFVQCDYDDPDAFARGRADILMISDDTTNAIIYDHKTQMNVETSDTFQMGFYAWVISRIYPFLDNVRTILHFAQFGMYSEEYEWEHEDLYGIEDEVITRVGILESKQEWSAQPHDKCQYCSFISDCPIIKEFIDIDKETGDYRVVNSDVRTLGDTGRAIKVAGLVHAMNEMVSNGKKELRNHVKDFGPIAIPGVVYDIRVKDEVNWKRLCGSKFRDKFYELCEKHEIEPKRFMGFSKTFSDSIWFDKNLEFVKEFRELVTIKPKSEFKGFKG